MNKHATAVRAVFAAVLAVALAVICVDGAGARAWANGAFPDSSSIMAPADRPHQIILATNFGLVLTYDDGQTWVWACEAPLTDYGRLYQMGPPPSDRLFAVSSVGAVYSDTDACEWAAAQGPVTNSAVYDSFPDPTDSNRVLVLAAPRNAAAPQDAVFESNDGGRTFPVVRYTAPPGDALTSVEISRSDPLFVYLTGYHLDAAAPMLLQSMDGGVSWRERGIDDGLGFIRSARLIAVDPDKPSKLFLRVSGDFSTDGDGGTNDGATTAGERLVITADAGESYQTPITLAEGKLTAFARMADGTLVVTGGIGRQSFAWRSDDGGATFLSLPPPPHVRALASRDGQLFAAADDAVDRFAIGVSRDRGMTWQPLLRFAGVGGIKDCVRASCRANCLVLADQGLWPYAVCDTPDSGEGAEGGGQDASAVDPSDVAPPDAEMPEKKPSNAGCSCQQAPSLNVWAPMAYLIILVTSHLCVRRRRRRDAAVR